MNTYWRCVFVVCVLSLAVRLVQHALRRRRNRIRQRQWSAMGERISRLPRLPGEPGRQVWINTTRRACQERRRA